MWSFPLNFITLVISERDVHESWFVLKRYFFNGKYLMLSEKSCLSLSCRKWFRRHWHTSQWTGFHQLCKCLCPFLLQELACFLIYRSHRWKLQMDSFFYKTVWLRRNTPVLCGLRWHFLTHLSLASAWASPLLDTSGSGGVSDTCSLFCWLDCPCNLQFLPCCFLEISLVRVC